MTLNCRMSRWLGTNWWGNINMISMAFCREGKDCWARPHPKQYIPVMATPLGQRPFPLTSHSQSQPTFTHTHTHKGHVLPTANIPHIFHNTSPRSAMAKLTEDCLPQKCRMKGHFLRPFGHLCQVDRWAASPCHWPFCADKVISWFLNGMTRQTHTTVSAGCYRVQNGFPTKWPAECKVYKVDNHCSIPPITLNYTAYPKCHFTKRVKYLNCTYFH